MMTRRERSTYRASDDRAFHRWITGTVVIGSITATAFGLMALAGSGFSISPREASADVSELTAVRKQGDRRAPLAFELMSRAPDQLPAQPADERAF